MTNPPRRGERRRVFCTGRHESRTRKERSFKKLLAYWDGDSFLERKEPKELPTRYGHTAGPGIPLGHEAVRSAERGEKNTPLALSYAREGCSVLVMVP